MPAPGVIMLGIGDLGASRKPGEVVRTLALGSCVAVIMLDPKTRTVGMDHVALPESKIGLAKAKELPGYFADTGVKALIHAMQRAGADRNVRGYIVKLAGGANVADPNNTFNIGKRNVLAIKKSLWQFGMGPRREDVGGRISRSVSVEVDTGQVILSSPGRADWKI